LAIGLAIAAASFAFITRLDPVFEFYFVMVYVGAALLAGYAAGTLVRAGRLLVRRSPDVEPWRPALACGVLLACAVVAATIGDSAFVLGRTADAEIMGERVTETWRDAPRLGALNAIVRTLWWSDSHVIGRPATAVTRYLWRQSDPYRIPAEAAAYVRAHAPAAATLFGDSNTVPLVALLSERRLALDEADTNAMRFATVTPPEAFIARLERAPPFLVLAGEDRGVFLIPEFVDWTARGYGIVETFDDPIVGSFRLLRRNDAGSEPRS
jgi:hypothetical protein